MCFLSNSTDVIVEQQCKEHPNSTLLKTVSRKVKGTKKWLKWNTLIKWNDIIQILMFGMLVATCLFNTVNTFLSIGCVPDYFRTACVSTRPIIDLYLQWHQTSFQTAVYCLNLSDGITKVLSESLQKYHTEIEYRNLPSHSHKLDCLMNAEARDCSAQVLAQGQA